RARTPDLHFETSMHTSGHYISVVVHMHASGLTATTAVATTVINVQSLEIITITDFNPNMLQVVNNRLNNEIIQNPRGFVGDFTGIDNSHPFYLNQNTLNVPFASGTLKPTRDIINITFHNNSIQNEVIARPMFRTLPEDAYNTIMVRILVAEYFGYTIGQIAESHTLSKGHLLVTITVGRNSYFLTGDEARTLELAPMLIDGEVYVPLSFFREILGLATTVVSESEILMSKWQSPDTGMSHFDEGHQMN
ncbi:MAG: copper amine oxidase N-terminal domain-containing protein, partial [Defluviitaleaceae bacterium]|nr:copper amine oxidase N-terminal domain-containing protein [Defluviitaleaceae bacterium]